MKLLIVGLGNIGREYQDTRHNIGFTVLDAYAKASNIFFEENRYGAIAKKRLKNKQLILLKPSTFMNLSGTAIRYWLQKEKIPIQNLLVVVDDLALPFGTLRLRPNGSSAGHNGLKNIEELIGTRSYARLRFGIDNRFSRGKQIDYVLSKWSNEEQEQLPKRVESMCEIIDSFCLAGIQITMNKYNNR